MADNNKTLLTKDDLIELNQVLINELDKHGMPAEDQNTITSIGLIGASAGYTMTNVINVLRNIVIESSPLTAQKPSSLYNQILQKGGEIILSTPSKLNVGVKIAIDSIISKGVQIQTNVWQITWTDSNIVILDDLEFIPTRGAYYVRAAKRDSNGYNTTVFYINSDGVQETIESQLTLFDGLYHIYFEVEMQQVVRVIRTDQFKDEQLDEFILSTNDPISSMRADYRDNSAKSWEELSLRPYYGRGLTKYVEYKIQDLNVIKLTYKQIQDGFQPVIGGQLRVTFNTTTGQDIYYSGAPEIKQRVPEGISIEYLPTNDEGIFISTGGRVAIQNREQLKDLIVVISGTRGRIDTEADMSTFLRRYEGSSVFRPKLVLNHVQTRLFNIYSALTFSVNLSGNRVRKFTVPTTSASVLTDLEQLPTRNIEGVEYYAITSDMTVHSVQNSNTDSYTLDPTGTKPMDTSNPDNFYYTIPFLLSYSPTRGLCRTFMDAQYNVAYPAKTIMNNDDSRISCRFMNVSFNMNDYMDEDTNKRVFNIQALIRGDNKNITLTDDNFRATMELEDIDGNKFYMKAKYTKVETEGANDNRYLLTFDMESDRKIFDRITTIKYMDGSSTISKDVNVFQTAVLKIEMKYTDPSDPDTSEWINVSNFSSDITLYSEVTRSVRIQVIQETGGAKIMSFDFVPMVSYDFYKSHHNKLTVDGEIRNIFNFIQTGIYDALGMMSNQVFNLKDKQETLFDVSIKFAKTYGRSKLYIVGAKTFVPLQNLQVKPTFNIRKKDNAFDTTLINDMLNDEFIQHDFVAKDLHISVLVSSVLLNSQDYVELFQFVNYDNYPPYSDMIKSNGLEEGDWDIPEILSLAPKWNETVKAYEHDVTYIEI